jgi:hypothetical protein
VARPEKKQETEELRLALPVKAMKYLGFLAANGLLGASENDVARNILLIELDRMITEKYHDRQIPE